jgi:hypothetical protein
VLTKDFCFFHYRHGRERGQPHPVRNPSSLHQYGHAWLYVWATAAAFFLLSIIQLVRSAMLEGRTSRLEDKLIALQGTVTALKFLERNPGSTTAAIDAAAVIRKLLAPAEDANS